ncbi:RNA polymerase II holoenzyme cyclin-like subunit [Stygiomarasmius scandens]|uniref:RNA polymerase II holoenzyme cyclin-like subunit n=1 Tax=Marasmiellus scandens TaxID=2682957 RepID=A0ABR1JE92_9AGAR
MKLGKKLQLRQRVIATATVFFRRFYLKNSYCETEPFLVIAACCYVAAKAEESPMHIKTVVQEAKTVFNREQRIFIFFIFPFTNWIEEPYNIKNFPSDNTKLAEMEFYLVDDLECDLTIFHPYRSLLALCKKASPNASPGPTSGSDISAALMEAEAGELQFGVGGDLLSADDLGVGLDAEDGPRYWGTGEGRLELSENAVQTAWFIINDTYRSNLCLLYPPHLIAIAAIYLTLILNPSAQDSIAHLLPSAGAEASSSAADTPSSSQFQPQSGSTPRRSSRQSSQTQTPTHTQDLSSEKQDPISFLANLNVSLSLISTISQEIISLYSLWDRYHEESAGSGGPAISSLNSVSGLDSSASGSQTSPTKGYGHMGPSPSAGTTPSNVSKRSAASLDGTPDTVDDLFGDGGSTMSGSSGSHTFRVGGHPSPADSAGANADAEVAHYTPASLFKELLKMREAKAADMNRSSHSSAVHRVVENLKVN